MIGRFLRVLTDASGSLFDSLLVGFAFAIAFSTAIVFILLFGVLGMAIGIAISGHILGDGLAVLFMVAAIVTLVDLTHP